LPFDIAAPIVNLVEAQHAGDAVAADVDREPQAGQSSGLERTRSGLGQLGRELVQHPDIVAGLETGGGYQCRAARLVQRVFELGKAVGRVDVDEDEPGLCRGELRDDPLGVVGRPDRDPLAGFETERRQPRCERIDPPLKLAVTPPDLLVAYDQRIALGETLGDAVETDADRLADQRRRACAMNVTRLRHSSTSPRNYFAARAPGCSVVKLATGCSAAITSTRSSQPDHSP